MSYQHILFDLDGTLSNPQDGIINSIVYSLDKMKFYEYTKETLLKFIGPPLKYSFSTYFSFTKAETELAIKYYREFFDEKGLYQNEIFPDIPILLDELKRSDKKLFIATSKPTVYAKKIIDRFGLSDLFVDIVGGELDGGGSDKTEVIKHILDTFNIGDRSDCIMVGDTKFDVIGANENHIDAVAVTYGFGQREELEHVKPKYIVNTIEELSIILTGRKLRGEHSIN